MPCIRQAFISAPQELTGDDLERRLYICRKTAESAVTAMITPENQRPLRDEFYICSLSSRTIVYKGMLIARQLKNFYADLRAESVVTTFGGR